MEASSSKPRSELVSILGRVLLAVAGGLALSCAIAGTSWSAGSYSESEIRSVESSDEAKIRGLRQEEITQLRIALGRHAPSTRRADLYLRLAEIYIEAYRSDYLLEGRVHDKRLEHGQTEPHIDHSRSRPNLLAGIAACKEILSFRIPFDKLDEVYYFLGFNYSELGERPTGVSYFNQLTQRFPGSQFVGEAYKELGEASFDSGDFRKAQAYLEQAVRHANAGDLPRVYHRLAWCYYRLKQFDRAVETMKLAIDSAQKSGEKFLSLREEAFRDLAVFMTETGRVEEAIAYFDKTAAGKSFYPEVLEKLGKQYERNVEPAKATLVYESLLKTDPNSEAGFRVRVKLVDLDLRRGRYKEALVRLNGIVLPKQNSGENSGSDTQIAAQNLRSMIRRTATENHEKFRKTGNRAQLDVAESYYTAYLTIFLAQADWRHETPEIQMYLAEVKREQGKAKEASDLYRTVLLSKDKRYAKEAGALWTRSLSEAIRKQAQKAGATKSAEPSALEVEFIEAADGLQEALGDTNEGREAALRAAEVLAGYKDTQSDARKRIRKLTERSPKSGQALTAALLWLQIASDPSNADASDDERDAIKALRSNTDLMASDQKAGGKLHGLMADMEARLKIGVIASEEKKSDFSAAGRDYESYANDASTRDAAEKAYTNAVASYLKVGDAEAVDRVSKSWLKRFPKSPRGIESLRGAASSFLVAGRFDMTARTFERLGREAGDADALETAARIYEGSGDAANAQQDRKEYLTAFPTNPHRGSVALDLARSQDAGHIDAQARESYKVCMSASETLYAECGARLGDLYMHDKDVEAAKSMYRKVGASRSTASSSKKKKKKAVAAVSSGEANSPFVGYARYKLALLLEQSAQFDALEMPEASLKRALNQRLGFLEPLSRAYLSAVEAGGPWAIAALDRLASFALKFADEVDGIAPPEQADEAAAERFRKNLGSVSNPLRRKAVDTWMNAYSKALAGETLSPALPEIADRLADAHVPSPSRAQGFHGRFRLAGVPADGGEGGKVAAFALVRGKLGKNPQDAAAWVDYGNLMWGEAKPLLARIAYERALSLNSRNPAALNNRGVVLISSEGEEDWQGALEGAILFRDALKQDEFFLASKLNRAVLFNYYRLFSKAKDSWDQVLVKFNDPDVYDGLGVALAGLGQWDASENAFHKGTEGGAASGRFVVAYHQAARAAASKVGDGEDKCLSALSDLDIPSLQGFERSSAERLKRGCTIFKSEESK